MGKYNYLDYSCAFWRWNFLFKDKNGFLGVLVQITSTDPVTTIWKMNLFPQILDFRSYKCFIHLCDNYTLKSFIHSTTPKTLVHLSSLYFDVILLVRYTCWWWLDVFDNPRTSLWFLGEIPKFIGKQLYCVDLCMLPGSKVMITNNLHKKITQDELPESNHESFIQLTLSLPRSH